MTGLRIRFSLSDKQLPLRSHRLFTSRTTVESLTERRTICSVQQNEIEGVSLWLLSELYRTRCYDLNIPMLEEQRERFYLTCKNQLSGRKFDLRECQIGETTAKVIGNILRKNESFSSVLLGSNLLRDSGVFELAEALAENLGVVHIDLSSNDISAGGLNKVFSALKSHPSLVSLNISSSGGLYRNKLGSLGAVGLEIYLKENKVITHLNIAGTFLGSEGLRYLTKGLKENTTLLSLNISNNLVNEPCTELFSVLATGKLHELVISDNRLKNSNIELLADCFLKKEENFLYLKKLDLGRTGMTTRGLKSLLYSLLKNRVLTSLNLGGNCFSDGLSTNFPEFLKTNYSLKTINLSSCSVKDSGLHDLKHNLGKNTGIVSLILSSNNIGTLGAKYLAEGLRSNSSIKNLNLSSNRIQNSGCILLSSMLLANTSLTSLNLSLNNIKDEGADSLLNSINQNGCLYIMNVENNPISPTYLDLLRKHCDRNRILYAKHNIPIMKRRIHTLRIHRVELESTHLKLATENQNRKQQTLRLKRKKLCFEQARRSENIKLKALTAESASLQSQSRSLSESLFSLLQGIKVSSTQLTYLSLKKEESAFQQKLCEVSYQLKHLAKENSQLKQEVAPHPSRLAHSLKCQLQSELNLLSVARCRLQFERGKLHSFNSYR